MFLELLGNYLEDFKVNSESWSSFLNSQPPEEIGKLLAKKSELMSKFKLSEKDAELKLIGKKQVTAAQISQQLDQWQSLKLIGRITPDQLTYAMKSFGYKLNSTSKKYETIKEG